jgi:hypothetical protein
LHWLHEMSPGLEKDLRKINEKLATDPKNVDLQRRRKKLREIINWVTEDEMKLAMRKRMALRDEEGSG